MRRARLDRSEELVGPSQRLVPVAAAVAVVGQHALVPADVDRRSRSARRLVRPRAASRTRRRGRRGTCWATAQVVVARGQRAERPGGRGDLDATLEIVEPSRGRRGSSASNPEQAQSARSRPSSQPSSSASARACEASSIARSFIAAQSSPALPAVARTQALERLGGASASKLGSELGRARRRGRAGPGIQKLCPDEHLRLGGLRVVAGREQSIPCLRQALGHHRHPSSATGAARRKRSWARSGSSSGHSRSAAS